MSRAALDVIPTFGHNNGMHTHPSPAASPVTPDLFARPEMSAPAAPVALTPPCPHFTLREDVSPSYAPRTYANAKADATFAYAVDFTTAGERLTQRAAGTRILQVPVGTPSADAAERLLAHLRHLQAHTLNVAGNGLYTLVRHFPHIPAQELQAKVDAYVLRVLALVHAQYPLTQVRSGGQTGIDESGIKAGIALGVPTLALLPNGYKIRTGGGEDITMSKAQAWRRFFPAASNPEQPL